MSKRVPLTTKVAITLALALAWVAHAQTSGDETSDAVRGDAPGRTVLFARWEGAITPVSADYLAHAIAAAEERDVEALVIELDTPGGLDSAMRRIIKAQLSAEVPIVVYVAPSGSRAASAGAFITMAAHVAAMAPSTNIGSASPVQMMGGAMDSVMSRKVTNDAVAYLEGIAKQRGRSEQWARRFVEDADNITAERALEENVIDLIAATRAELLDALDGRDVELIVGSVVLDTRGARIEERNPGWTHRLLGVVADPTIAYMLLLLGVYGIFFELSNPGSILPGVVGALAILLALFALQALPVRVTGLALIGLAVVLFVLEVYVTSFGLLGLAGVAALVFGSAMLFEPSPDGPRLGWGVIVPAAVVTGGFVLLCATLAVRSQKRPVATGIEAMIGEGGRVVLAIDGPDQIGRVMVHGELWNAESDVSLAADARVEIVSVTGRTVRVRPRAPMSSGS